MIRNHTVFNGYQSLITLKNRSIRLINSKDEHFRKAAQGMERGVHKWMQQCALPDDTELQEHTLKTGQSIVIGDKCTIDYGLQGDDVIVSEFCTINGNILADGDVRIDNWCEVNGDVVTFQDAYLGESVKIHGRLIVSGDLDIGDNVQIEKGFEAKGWINIRNPLPVIAYIMLYLVALLGLDREVEVDAFLDELFSEDEEEYQNDGIPLMIPPSSMLNMEIFSVPGSMVIGARCRMHGNIKAMEIAVDNETTVFGSLRADGSISIQEGSAIHGDVTTGGDVVVSSGVHILGDVRCGSLTIHEDARVDGTMKAPEGVRIERSS
jgi:predicted acyltransferase (DUF342 family)